MIEIKLMEVEWNQINKTDQVLRVVQCLLRSAVALVSLSKQITLNNSQAPNFLFLVVQKTNVDLAKDKTLFSPSQSWK